MNFDNVFFLFNISNIANIIQMITIIIIGNVKILYLNDSIIFKLNIKRNALVIPQLGQGI